MLSCLVPPRFGQEDKITMPSSTAFSLQFPSLASSLHHTPNSKSDDGSATSHSEYMIKCPQCQQRISCFQALRDHLAVAHPQQKQFFDSHQNYHHHHSNFSSRNENEGNNRISSTGHSIIPDIPSSPISSGCANSSTDLTSNTHHHGNHQQQKAQIHQQHQHAVAMAMAGIARTSPPSISVNGYDEGGRSTSSPGSCNTLGDICGVLSGAMGGPGGPHSCSQCSASFQNRDLLEKHELLHSPNTTVSCKVCHKTFANVYRLQRHMISHDESALLRKFKCMECDKAFKFKHHLKEHVRIHSGEKPFGCDNCGKRFSHSGSYSSHMTSKKCISMGLKLNNNRSMLKTLEKSGALAMNSTNPKRGLPPSHMAYFSPSLPNVSMQAGLTNTAATVNNNAFYPILPKYSNYDAMNAALLASFQNPFYSMAALDPRIHPYSIHRLLELTAAGGSRLQSDPEDMIEEVSEDVTDESKLVVDLGNTECVNGESRYDKSQTDSARNSVDVCNSPESENDPLSQGHLHERIAKQELEQTASLITENFTDVKVELNIGEETKDCLQCNRCDKKFNHHTELVQHERVLCGLLSQQQNEIEAGNSSYLQSGSEEDIEERDCKNSTENERKVRVRTAITEEQQTILKEHYAMNARPSREEFRVIATRLGLDARVVQVWFQNNRSRERKLNSYNLGSTNFTSPGLTQSLSPAYNSVQNNSTEDQPLDLSIKKEVVLLPTSPRYGTAPLQSDYNEAMNLSRKFSLSPTSYRPFHYCNTATPHRPSEISTLIRQTPSPHESLPRQQTNSFVLSGTRNMVPMECLLQMTPEYARNQLLGLKLGERGTSLSPGSEKRSWRDDDSRISHEDEYNLLHHGKRLKLENCSSDIDCPFVCDQCDKAFSKQSSLARHKYEHSGQRPYKCEECPKAFKHKHHLTEHKRLHSGEKPFQCTKCLKRFSHSGSYSQHMNHRYSYCKPYRE